MTVNNDYKKRLSLRPLLAAENTYGSILFIGLCDTLDPAWLDWEPKTVQLEINDQYGVEIDPDQFDRLMAARTVVLTDLALTSLPSFIRIINALNGEGVDTPAAQPIDPEDLCWGLLEIQLLWPFDGEDQLSPEIIAYIETSLKYSGVVSYPRVVAHLLPPAKFDTAITGDPDLMAMQADRAAQIQESVQNRLELWYSQLEQLTIDDKNKEKMLRNRIQKADPVQTEDNKFTLNN